MHYNVNLIVSLQYMPQKHYNIIYRIMHWSMAACVLILLLTIFLRLTWMNKHNMADIIQNYLNTTNISLSHEETIILAKQIRKPMWNWHIYTGYALSGLFGIRLLLPFFGQMKFANPFNNRLSLKQKFQYSVYFVFYTCIALSLTTGLGLTFGPISLKKSMEEVHKLSIYYLIIYLIIHISGVLIAELKTQRGIISEIIGGNRKQEDNNLH